LIVLQSGQRALRPTALAGKCIRVPHTVHLISTRLSAASERLASLAAASSAFECSLAGELVAGFAAGSRDQFSPSA
jgi:hypothetical protein